MKYRVAHAWGKFISYDMITILKKETSKRIANHA